MATIPFNRPYMTGKELGYIAQAHANGHLAGDGSFTKQCQTWLEARTGAQKALLTHSCTAALEMDAILADIQPGDEAIWSCKFSCDGEGWQRRVMALTASNPLIQPGDVRFTCLPHSFDHRKI